MKIGLDGGGNPYPAYGMDWQFADEERYRRPFAEPGYDVPGPSRRYGAPGPEVRAAGERQYMHIDGGEPRVYVPAPSERRREYGSVPYVEPSDLVVEDSMSERVRVMSPRRRERRRERSRVVLEPGPEPSSGERGRRRIEMRSPGGSLYDSDEREMASTYSD